MGADEYREFARQQQLRFERMIREWRADRERRDAIELRRHQEVMARLEDERAKDELMLADHRAQLGALLAVLDRLNGGGGAEPAT